MAAVLGISANYHDAAAALVVDGQIVAAMQQERFSRIKNDPSIPHDAALACLDTAGIDAGALDAVVFHENPYRKLERILTGLLRQWPRGITAFPRALSAQLGGKLQVLDVLARTLGVPRARVHHASHHRSHAASAFLCSPFERAAVLTVDAVGEHASTGVWRGEGTALTELGSVSFPHSLGLVYSALTAYLGFQVYEGEFKVMGLASFGEPRHLDAFSALLWADGPGRFRVDPAYFDTTGASDVGFTDRLERLLGPRRSPRAPWDLTTPEDQRYADIAASLQHAVEAQLLALAQHARRETGADALCLAGGVALNAVANARIAREAGFAELFVQPAAGDAGGALGAALLGAVERGDPRPRLEHAALGVAVDGAVAHALARGLGLSAERVSDPVDTAAERIARGEIVGWCQGRFEWGPRALGQRSLLARPGPASVRDHINRVVKRREPFRPFAPAVTDAAADQWFGPHAAWPARFMTTTAPVRSDVSGLAAVTHVDGSARLQRVPAGAPFHRLLDAVEVRTGVPVVLNTSLNGKGEPIVSTEADALGFLLSHPIDGMLIDDVLITRS